MNIFTAMRILVAISILLLPLVAVTPVSADAPVHETFTIDEHFPLETPCGYPIEAHIFGTIKETSWFDRDGQLIRLYDEWGQMNATWSANGKSVDVNVKGPGHYTLTADTEIDVYLGTSNFVTIPGYGHVLGSAGQILARYDLQGNFISIDKWVGTGDPLIWAPFCDYLAP